jgi:hypothetical protein
MVSIEEDHHVNHVKGNGRTLSLKLLAHLVVDAFGRNHARRHAQELAGDARQLRVLGLVVAPPDKRVRLERDGLFGRVLLHLKVVASAHLRRDDAGRGRRRGLAQQHCHSRQSLGGGGFGSWNFHHSIAHLAHLALNLQTNNTHC